MLGPLLQSVRLRRSLTQVEVAERAGARAINQRRLSAIERGRSGIDAGQLELLLDALDATPAEREAVRRAAADAARLPVVSSSPATADGRAA